MLFTKDCSIRFGGFTPLFLILSVFFHFSCTSQAPAAGDTEELGPLDPFEQNELIGRGVNLGNALEAPNEGDWGVVLQEEYFMLIKNAGFNSVRIPIRWSAHAQVDSPYSIKPTFFSRVDWAIGKARSGYLAVIINIHHYEEIMEEPAEHKKRFLGLWKQIAARYQDYPNDLFFEILNEPNDKLTAEIWNDYLKEAIELIRESNPYRTLIVGTAEWGGPGALSKLQLPDDDNLIVTYHYYSPFQFTHQGAGWVDGSNAWLGTTWTATTSQKEAVRNDFDGAKAWAEAHNRPLFMGEFGAYSKADMNSRIIWTDFVSREAEKCNFSWAYWEFCSGFGVYNSSTNSWNSALLTALIPESKTNK